MSALLEALAPIEAQIAVLDKQVHDRVSRSKTCQALKKLKATGATIFLVEQNAFAALGICDRGYVLETGEVKIAGTGAALLADDRVREAYLGI